MNDWSENARSMIRLKRKKATIENSIDRKLYLLFSGLLGEHNFINYSKMKNYVIILMCRDKTF